MATLTIELPARESQAEFNLQRWEEILGDPYYASLEGRVETDRFGRVIMSPPPAAPHSRYQGRIIALLLELLPDGETMPECVISTADGVKAADVAWASVSCLAELGNRAVFLRCPEICVEVLSPSNTRGEIDEKTRLYFDAAAKEVWICDHGKMTFLGPNLQPLAKSNLCPEFPSQIKLR